MRMSSKLRISAAIAPCRPNLWLVSQRLDKLDTQYLAGLTRALNDVLVCSGKPKHRCNEVTARNVRQELVDSENDFNC